LFWIFVFPCWELTWPMVFYFVQWHLVRSLMLDPHKI
jgi:hypothetical protein